MVSFAPRGAGGIGFASVGSSSKDDGIRRGSGCTWMPLRSLDPGVPLPCLFLQPGRWPGERGFHILLSNPEYPQSHQQIFLSRSPGPPVKQTLAACRACSWTSSRLQRTLFPRYPHRLQTSPVSSAQCAWPSSTRIMVT